MTQEKLLELGLTKEQTASVMQALDGAFVPKARFNEVNGELSALKVTLKERDGQLESLKTAQGDADVLRQNIAQLQADNKTKDEAHAAELIKLRTDGAVERALLTAKAKNTVAAKALLAEFLQKAELDDDGSVKGLAKEIDRLRGGEDTGFLFETGTTGSVVAGATPAGTPSAPAPDPVRSGFEGQLAEARRNKDNLRAIAVKQEAADKGIVLM